VRKVQEMPIVKKQKRNASYQARPKVKTQFDSFLTYFFSPTKNVVSDSRTPAKRVVKEEKMELEPPLRNEESPGFARPI
jgi:hypothetical protein